MTALRIEIVSDPVCPWCYIGKRRLDAALTRYPQVEVAVKWTPFQLAPDMPPEGRDRAEHYASIFGEERAGMIRESMADTARAEGLDFQWHEGARSPNTLRAHVVMALAQDTPGADAAGLAEAMFRAHHVDCADLGDTEVLVELGKGAGVAEEAVRAAIADPEAAAKVRVEVQQAAARGVSGVPFFIFNDRYAVSGAQPADALAEVIDRLTVAD